MNLLPTNLDFMKEAVTHNSQRTQKLQPSFYGLCVYLLSDICNPYFIRAIDCFLASESILQAA